MWAKQSDLLIVPFSTSFELSSHVGLNVSSVDVCAVAGGSGITHGTSVHAVASRCRKRVAVPLLHPMYR